MYKYVNRHLVQILAFFTCCSIDPCVPLLLGQAYLHSRNAESAITLTAEVLRGCVTEHLNCARNGAENSSLVYLYPRVYLYLRFGSDTLFLA